MAKLGFVGLGVMGSEMVLRLLSKGHTVTGYNRTRSKAERVVQKGMKGAIRRERWQRRRTWFFRW